MSKKFSFSERVVVITGAGSGLGRAYALAFARRGAKVVVNDLGGGIRGEGIDGNGASRNPADAVVAEIQASVGEAVANYDSVENGDAIVEAALNKFGRVDIVINNAGILRDKSFLKMTDEDWDLVYRVHVLGAYKVTHAAWPVMRSQGFGRIVNTSSTSGIYGAFGQANYAMAKLGLYGMTQTLAREGAKYNITANAIAPIASSRLSATVTPAEVLAVLKPELVAPLVMRLCADENTETGSLFEVGGAWMAKLRWQRNEGIAFDPQAELSPEQIDQRWNELTAFEKVEYPGAYDDPARAFKRLFDNVGVSLSDAIPAPDNKKTS